MCVLIWPLQYVCDLCSTCVYMLIRSLQHVCAYNIMIFAAHVCAEIVPAHMCADMSFIACVY